MFCIGQGPAGTGASSPSSQLPSHSKLAGDSISTPTSPHTPQAASPELRPLLLQVGGGGLVGWTAIMFSAAGFLQLSDFHQLKQHLSAEVADQSNIIRHLALRAEDYRLMAD